MPLYKDSDLPKLLDKRLVEIEHFQDGSVYLTASDGIKIELWAYGHIYTKDKTR